MSRRIIALIAVQALVLAILMGLAIRRAVVGTTPQAAAVGGPFQLVDQTGATVSEDVLRGKWSAVFFGFTNCPDICPSTLFEMGQVETLLGERAEDFQTVFISVDPARDTPERVAEYVALEAFPRHILGLTGSAQQVDAAAKAYGVYYQRQGEGDDYTVNHASYTYLMGPKGQFVCVLPYELTPQGAASRIGGAMQDGPSAQSC